MAALTGAVSAVFDIGPVRGGSVAHTVSAAENQVKSCKISVTYAGTYAQADDTTINPATAIQNATRDGGTVTVLAAAVADSGVHSSTLYSGGACTVSSSIITMPLTVEDLTTEVGDAVAFTAAGWTRPITLHVFYRQALV